MLIGRMTALIGTQTLARLPGQTIANDEEQRARHMLQDLQTENHIILNWLDAIRSQFYFLAVTVTQMRDLEQDGFLLFSAVRRRGKHHGYGCNEYKSNIFGSSGSASGRLMAMPSTQLPLVIRAEWLGIQEILKGHRI